MADDLVKRLRAAVSEKFVGRTGASCVAGLRKAPICQAAADEIERLRAELAQISSYCAALTERMLEAEAALPTAEQIEAIRRLADRYAVLYGVAEHGHPEAADNAWRAWAALHAALDALRGSQRGQAASSAVTSAARSS